MKKFIEHINEEGKPVKVSGGGVTHELMPGQEVSFTHGVTGKKVTGTFNKRATMGGRQYAHVSMPDKTAMYIPPHHIDKPIKEAKEMTSANVKKALKHDCASHVFHEEYGEGFCIPEMHTIVEVSEGVGYVTHYDVMFEDRMVCDVPVEELKILEAMMHGHTAKKKKKVYDEEVVIEKMTDDANKNIQRALGSKHQTNNLRKTSSAAKAMINIAKSNPKNMK